jgi:SAM-dependent methyltransferase
MTSNLNQDSPYIGPKIGGFAVKLSWYARQKMFESLMQIAGINSETTVLDIGVTSDRREDCNFFEKLYPYPQKIVAVGTEDASFLEQDYPGLTFVKTDGSCLPFPDRSFDLVVSFAVIEHVGSNEQQHAFVRELCRVGRSCFITTPNRWYPIEFHTALPFLHWLPAHWFRKILRSIGKGFWAREENLNLLSEREMLNFFPPTTTVHRRYFRLFGFISNLVYYVEN